MKLETLIQSRMPYRIPSLFLNISLHALKKQDQEPDDPLRPGRKKLARSRVKEHWAVRDKNFYATIVV